MFFTFLLPHKSTLFKTQGLKYLTLLVIAALATTHFSLQKQLKQQAHDQHQARIELKNLPDITTLTQAQRQHHLLEKRHQKLLHLHVEQNIPIHILHTLLYTKHDQVQLHTLNLSKTKLFLTGHVLSHSALEQWITKIEASALLVSPHIVSIQVDERVVPTRYQFQLRFNVHLSTP